MIFLPGFRFPLFLDVVPCVRRLHCYHLPVSGYATLRSSFFFFLVLTAFQYIVRSRVCLFFPVRFLHLEFVLIDIIFIT